MTTRQFQLRGALRSMDPTHERGTPLVFNIDGNFRILHDRLAAMEQVINRMMIVEQRRLENAKVDTSRQVIAGTALTGGGALTADVTLNVDVGAIDHDSTLNYVLAQHRIINDAGTAATELFSASEIISRLAGKNAVFTSEDSINAGANTQGARAVTANFLHVSVVASANDSITLPVVSTSAIHIVANEGAESMNIYPASGEYIDSAAQNAAIALAAGGRKAIWYQSPTKWRSVTL